MFNNRNAETYFKLRCEAKLCGLQFSLLRLAYCDLCQPPGHLDGGWMMAIFACKETDSMSLWDNPQRGGLLSKSTTRWSAIEK
uniref:Uncharacterized protein n=1 Tax=Anguilla anguilla TaxID=7936 RepID=A0A0E9PQE9_ANGAN